MPRPLPEALRAPVTDTNSAIAWLDALIAAEMSFHLEDSPEDIIHIRTDEPLFSPEDVPLIRERVGELYGVEWGVFSCPIGYILAAQAERGELDFWTFGEEIEYSNGQTALVVAVGEGPERKRAILKCAKGYMVAERSKELYAANDFIDVFEERDLFRTAADAIAEAGGLWKDRA